MISRPSKKVTLIALACVLAVGGIFFSSQVSKEKNGEGTTENSVLQMITPENQTVDSDTDGLKDWEEELWESNPKIADTDGDGTNDGDEIKQSRNPVVAGPKDTFEVSAAVDIAPSLSENLSETDKFSRELLSRYLAAKQNNDSVSGTVETKIVSDLLQSETLELKPRVYGISNLKIATSETSATERTYGDNLRTILKKYSPTNLENELVIVNRARQNEDASELVALDPIIKGFDALLKAYLALEVPPSAAQNHVNLVNSLSMILESDRAMRTMFEDPLKGYAGISEYTKAVVLLQQAMTATVMYFERLNISFSPL